MSRTDEIKARLSAVTPGPWSGDRYDGTVKCAVLGGDRTRVLQVDHKNGTSGFSGLDGDEALAVNAPADIAYLLGRVAALEAGWHEQQCDPCGVVVRIQWLDDEEPDTLPCPACGDLMVYR